MGEYRGVRNMMNHGSCYEANQEVLEGGLGKRCSSS